MSAVQGEVKVVDLGQIRNNPFNPRTTEDSAAVAEVALSIATQGLLQKPVAREVMGSYELAFGHTRKAAFELLATKGLPEHGIPPGKEYKAMPLEIHAMTDRQMFEAGTAENLKRRDLTTMETAAALQRYMDEFEATSQEAGALFGMNDATVRGKVRLLELPKEAREKLDAGELSEVEARQLLTVQRVAPKGGVKAVMKWVERGFDVEDGSNRVLQDNKEVVHLGYVDREAKTVPMGRHAWPADMKPEQFPMADLPPLDEKVKENREHLLAPPACGSCEFLAKVGGQQYCGLRVCYERKQVAWFSARLAAACKKTGIAAYDEAKDGDFREMEAYSVEWAREAGKKEKDPDLRLAVNTTRYGSFTGLTDGIVPLWVGAKLKKPRHVVSSRSKGDTRKSAAPKESVYERNRRLEEERESIFTPFVWESATGFLKALQITAVPVLDQLLQYGEWEQYQKYVLPKGQKMVKQSVAYKQRLLAFDFLMGVLIEQKDLHSGKLFLEDIAKELQVQAKAWGIKLPETVMVRAKAYHASVAEKAAVAAATAKKKAAGKKEPAKASTPKAKKKATPKKAKGKGR